MEEVGDRNTIVVVNCFRLNGDPCQCHVVTRRLRHSRKNTAIEGGTASEPMSRPSTMSFERTGLKSKSPVSSASSSDASTPPPTQTSSATPLDADPPSDAANETNEPMIHAQYPPRAPMPHPYYPPTPPVQQQPIQVQAPNTLHLNQPHGGPVATHKQSNARGNGEDEEEEDDDGEDDDDSFEGENNNSSHRGGDLRGGVVDETMDMDMEQEARRRSIAYASHMPSSYSLPFQSGQHDPRLVASQANEGPSTSSPPSTLPNATSTTTYLNGVITSPSASGSNVNNEDSAVPTGTKRKRGGDNTGTEGSPSSSSYHPKMRLANGTSSKIKVKNTGGKAAAIEALAAAEAATHAAIIESSPSSVQPQQVPRSQASSGSGHGSAGEEDPEGGDDSPQNGGVIPDGAQEINPDGSITVHGMRLPPIMQVEKQHVTTTATQAASASRRRNEAQFHCPVPGCGSTFTRRFNLRGGFTLYGQWQGSILTLLLLGHLRSHTEERPFQCEWPGCGKSFARKHDCNRHMTLHSSMAVQHACAGCGKSFSRTDALNRHCGCFSSHYDGCKYVLNIVLPL